MNDFMVEFFIVSGEEQSTKLSSLNEKEMEQWKKDIETRALSEYYNKKIIISSKKI